MARINITCDTCKTTHHVRRTNEIPAHIISMGCNWCPLCEDKSEGNYEEWYNKSDNNNTPHDIPNNQLVMPFIFDDINDNTISITINPAAYCL